MWWTVCLAAPQSHSGEGAIFHLWWESLQFPWPVLILLRAVHVLRGESNPGGALSMHGIICIVGYGALFRSSFHMFLIWKLLNLNSLAALIGGFLERNRLILTSLMSSCIGSWGFLVIFSNSLSKAFYRRSSGGGMWLSSGSHWVGVDLSVPDISRMVVLSCTSMSRVYELLSHTGAQYSAAEYTIPRAEHLRVAAVDPHVVPHSLWMILLRVLSLAAVFWRCCLNDRVLSRVTPKYFGLLLCLNSWLSAYILSCLFAILLFKWKQDTSVLLGLGLSLHCLK